MCHWRVYMNDVPHSLCDDDYIVNHDRKQIQNARPHVEKSGCCSSPAPCVNQVVTNIILGRLHSSSERIRVVWQLENLACGIGIRARVWSTHWYDDCTAKWSYPTEEKLARIFTGAIIHYYDDDDEEYDISKNHSDACCSGPYHDVYGG